MGRLLLIGRLAMRDLRLRRAGAILLLLAFTAATMALALGLVLNGVSNQPYLRTRNATAGPDVVLRLNPNGSAARKWLARLAALEHASGGVGHTGPYLATWARLSVNGHAAGAQVEGREIAPASIDRPKITQGSWLRGNGTAAVLLAEYVLRSRRQRLRPPQRFSGLFARAVPRNWRLRHETTLRSGE